MGGGNGQKSKTARERNMEKLKAASKGSQLESNKKAMTIQVGNARYACKHSSARLRRKGARGHGDVSEASYFPSYSLAYVWKFLFDVFANSLPI
ncbi:hypothetical protein TIFTF001_005015 [Ficus carica]|uniref:Small EDRK-rich factor-like N-terminal domain-containing protein n=1 Tax=Ficus carica TaxID=3494 RepID=A0AA88DE01_FICCA|nr:hypothetical protein TIFTF001_005015 [Ficus carica]